MDSESKELEQLLAGRVGLDPLSVGSPLILRAVRQRMKELGLEDMNAYQRWARQSDSELQSLIEEVVVSESWFFRDDRPYQCFRKYVQAHWINDQRRPTLRVLSLACASGEEPYSIAMTLRDLSLPVQRFEIDAVDISSRQLAIARRGVYSSNAFRGSELSFRTRYFREHPQGYELDSSIRSTVHFLQASVLAPDLLAGSAYYDVVFCRNLLIYLEVPARLRLLAVIERLLAADGLLFIGHADRLDISGVEPRFIMADDPGSFVYRRRGQGNSDISRLLRLPNPPRSLSALSGPGVTSSGNPAVHSLDAIAITADSDQPAQTANSSLSVDDRPLLDQAAELANQGRFNEAVTACERHVRLKGFSPTAYYLMGMIFQAAGNRSRAEECFHKTLYLDHLHDEALLALALLAERRGDHDAAGRFRRRAERSVAKPTKQVH